MDESMQYRAAVRPNFVDEQKVSIRDEAEYSTLKKVQGLFEESLSDLKSNFNAFSVLNSNDPEKDALKLLIDIRSRQITYSIISNLKAMVDSAIEKVDAKNKE